MLETLQLPSCEITQHRTTTQTNFWQRSLREDTLHMAKKLPGEEQPRKSKDNPGDAWIWGVTDAP